MDLREDLPIRKGYHWENLIPIGDCTDASLLIEARRKLLEILQVPSFAREGGQHIPSHQQSLGAHFLGS
jgi:hypothetical protein